MQNGMVLLHLNAWFKVRGMGYENAHLVMNNLVPFFTRQSSFCFPQSLEFPYLTRIKTGVFTCPDPGCFTIFETYQRQADQDSTNTDRILRRHCPYHVPDSFAREPGKPPARAPLDNWPEWRIQNDVRGINRVWHSRQNENSANGDIQAGFAKGLPLSLHLPQS